MATTHSYFIGQRIHIPQFHLLFTPKSPYPKLLINKPSSFCVSFPVSDSFASRITSLNPKRSLSLSRLCNCAAADGPESPSSCEYKWDWDRWSRHFSEVEEIDSLVSLLKCQLEDAIKEEDYKEAAKLQKAIGEAIVNDAVAEIMLQLQTAISEERYHDAFRLCSHTGSGLVGWWVCYPQDSEEPVGMIVRITPGVGRFIGKSYSPRQLVTAAPGTPLFEIFVVKDTDGGYAMQVVYLQHFKLKSSISEDSYLSAQQSSNASVESPSTGSEVKLDEKEGIPLNAEDLTEEGIENVIRFLKDKISGLILKVTELRIPAEEIVGSDAAAAEEVVGEGIEETSSADNEEDDCNIEETSSMDSADSEKHLNNKHFIEGALHSTEDFSIEDKLVRVPADIRDNERDSFILHVPGRSKCGIDTRKNTVSEEQVTALEAQGISDLMPPEFSTAYLGLETASLKVSRNVLEIAKLGYSHAQRGNQLSEYTAFNRIIPPESDLDPFDGLYVGEFKPYGTEVVQFKHKYGRWNDTEGSNLSDVELFEYVEAVKLTGELAGQVIFRARIDKKNHHRWYPEEMGVSGSYIGEGRYKNPKWIKGLLLSFNGKGSHLMDAELGLIYIGSAGKSVMVYFNRLRLPH